MICFQSGTGSKGKVTGSRAVTALIWVANICSESKGPSPASQTGRCLPREGREGREITRGNLTQGVESRMRDITHTAKIKNSGFKPRNTRNTRKGKKVARLKPQSRRRPRCRGIATNCRDGTRSRRQDNRRQQKCQILQERGDWHLSLIR